MRNVVSPNDYFAKCIQSDVNELPSNAERIIKMCNKKDIINMFKKNLTKTVLSLDTKETNEDLVTFTPDKMIFTGNEQKIANIINMSPKDQKFSVTSLPKKKRQDTLPLATAAPPSRS